MNDSRPSKMVNHRADLFLLGP